ncbi:ead/Ea22-like family protein [Salmonella enterica]|nr:ead/Ea22-like family protein [Salmonella enterica]EBW7941423.1 ead/Ea22-like family protein [Salmonella enterica subsp. enterica serovar Newport]EBJ2056486.1 ead/Ea22-like family protein [Salmonella enterica]EGP4161124.1 ead/Ea22-like family protein [Salmonella enterica]EHC9512030.1 ead/Ea22-like family protein [Salmonella enterica subsp. enterica serovar Newport]
MSNIDKQALRETAEKALPAMQRLLMMPNDELFDEAALNVDGDVDAANAFNLLAGPETMLALLDELDKKQQYIKLRDQENEDIALTVGKLRVELEHYKSREERVTKLVLDNSTSWDVLYEKLEAAEKRIAEQREYYEGVIADGSKRIAELEARAVNLPKRSVDEVMHLSGFSRDYAEGWCAGNDNAIHEIRAAGIKVKGA